MEPEIARKLDRAFAPRGAVSFADPMLWNSSIAGGLLSRLGKYVKSVIQERELREPGVISLKNRSPTKNLEGRCLQRLEASETPLGAASGSPPTQSATVFQLASGRDLPIYGS